MVKPEILVVDDEVSIGDTVATCLRGLYETVCATRVDDALDELMSRDISLVLLDCTLPGETMWQVVLEADRLSVPVVLMTGDDKRIPEIVNDPRPYILKPFSLARLLDTLDGATEAARFPAT
jgi:DNA-binding response OmpR family regulator